MSKTIEERYQLKQQREHILERPDMYIGSIEQINTELYLFDDISSTFQKRFVVFCPGLYKLFDEILVNAIDESQKNTVKKIKVDVNPETGLISVFNDGSGIPIELHREHNIYVPELIFGNLLSGSNYDDAEERIVGGKNGLGAKLANIYSTFFQVETVCNGKKYIQRWGNNMTTKSKPVITSKKTGGEYTKITFVPEYKRFDPTASTITQDFIDIIRKRCYDASACTAKNVSVYFQEKVIPAKTFEAYVGLYMSPSHKRVYEGTTTTSKKIWEVVATLNADPSSEFEQVSFVNGIWTIRGGKHVEYITKQIISKLTAVLKSKNSKMANVSISPGFIKNRLQVYVRSTIVNPSFESQSKEVLSTQSKNFGSEFKLSDKFITNLSKFEVLKEIIEDVTAKDERKVHSSSDAKKSARILGIPKYTRALLAGTKHSAECTLFLVEGDSAKSFAEKGLAAIGNEKNGIFPLRGKLINVREATRAQREANMELYYLKQILGLTVDKVYKSKSELNYGNIMILTDADDDGHHIKGLVINFFDTWWPSLTRLPGFIKSMRTPVVKATLAKKPPLEFFSYTEFKNSPVANDKRYKIKYYKGLGSSEKTEIVGYFKRLGELTTEFTFGTKEDTKGLELAFSKSCILNRKEWLLAYNPSSFDDAIIRQRQISVWTFINEIMVQFSYADLKRSLASICDGLKTSQRKVIYTCIEDNIVRPQKVNELGGIVSAKTAYHHGEASITGTITGMAQDFWATNNISFLYGDGDFADRAKGSDKPAAARYISTYLNKVTKSIFHEDDSKLYTYNKEDNKTIEPEFYLPIIPTVLINGVDGIGTGFSCQIPKYNPLDIVSAIYKLLEGQTLERFSLTPWYRHYKGSITISNEEKHQYSSTGIFERVGSKTVRITELPIGKFGTWTDPYKEFIESCVIGYADSVKNIPSKSSSATDLKKAAKAAAQKEEFFTDWHPYIMDDDTVKIEAEFESKEYLDELVKTGEIYKKLKLVDTINITNMHLFDTNGKIRKYECPEDIITEFYAIRLKYYIKRKEYMLKKYRDEFVILNSKVRYIEEVLIAYDEKKSSGGGGGRGLDIFRKKKQDIDNILGSRGYHRDPVSGFGYLNSMPMHTFSEETIAELQGERNKKQAQIDTLSLKTPKRIWADDLENFVQEYNRYLEIQK